MGKNTAAPINEAVYLLSQLDPDGLTNIKAQFPLLSTELELGVIGGKRDARNELDFERAQIQVDALKAGKKRAEKELLIIHKRISASKKGRLWSQIISLLCSSGVLAGVVLDQDLLTKITALLTLAVSLGTIYAEHKERLLRQNSGDIYDAFEKINALAFKSGVLSDNIKLLIKHRISGTEITTSIENANLLCEELNKWLAEVSSSS